MFLLQTPGVAGLRHEFQAYRRRPVPVGGRDPQSAAE